MANIRQYIGARYVFKIYENSQDPSSAEWEAGVTYEPLTIVTYLNSTYASKKDVPGAIGNPAQNPTYWIVTGAYNGQIATLQQQIDTINAAIQTLANEISEVKNRKIVLIGDSYSGGVYGATGWVELVETKLNLTRNVNVFDSLDLGGIGGGFVASNAAFNTQLDSIYGAMSEPENITDIYVFGGQNDYQYTETQIKNGIATFVSNAKTKFPHAIVHIGFIGRGTNRSIYTAMNTATRAYISGAMENGADYITNSEYVNRLYTDYNNDMIHPNSFVDIANYIAGAIVNGHIDVQRQVTRTIPLTSNIAADATVVFNITQSNDITYVKVALNGWRSVSEVPSNAIASVNAGIKLADWAMTDLLNCNVSIPLLMNNSNSSTTFEVDDMCLDIIDGQIRLRGCKTNSSGWVTFPAANALSPLQPVEFILPTQLA